MNHQSAYPAGNWNYTNGGYPPPTSSMKYGATNTKRPPPFVHQSNHEFGINVGINAAATAFNLVEGSGNAATTDATTDAADALCDAADFNFLSSLAGDINEYYELT